jgi:hypothetical protein
MTKTVSAKNVVRDDPSELDFHPERVPEVYASVCKGNCLEPEYCDGACLVFSRIEPPQPGDFVGIWFRREVVPPGEHPRQVKRLVSAGWPGMTLPYQVQPGDEVEPLIILEMLNPPKRIMVRASKDLAMHKVIGEAARDGDGNAYLPKTQITSSYGDELSAG